MPYYVGADSPEWETYLDQAESENIDRPPTSAFQYVEPEQAKASVLSFPATPGPEPIIPGEPQSPSQIAQPPATQGFFARLFGTQPTPAPAPAPTAEQWQDWHSQFQEREAARSKHALWKVSARVARFRAMGVKRVVGSYDGGGDESFTHFHYVEMNDGRRIDHKDVDQQGPDYSALIEDAASAIMGTFDAGEFVLHGALTIDFDVCTITDEKDAAIVFGFVDGTDG